LRPVIQRIMSISSGFAPKLNATNTIILDTTRLPEPWPAGGGSTFPEI
jgi:hypothetical protein